MIYTRTYLRTDNDAPINFDLGDHEPIPPETWRECGQSAHLWKAKAQVIEGRWFTVATCSKCGAALEPIPHPSSANAFPHFNKKTAVPQCTVTPLVVAYLKEHGPSRGRVVADALGVNHQMINKVMNRTPGIERVGEVYDGRNGQNVAIWGWKGA